MPRCDGIVARVRLLCVLGVAALCAAILCVGCGWRESAGSGVVLGLTLATNESGDLDASHESVLEVAGRYASDFERLVRGVLHLL